MTEAKGKILLLTNDVNVGVVAARYLNRQGYDVSSVLDPDKALEKYVAEQPDLVLMEDLGSSMRNIRFLRRLRHLTPGPIIVPVLMSGTPGADIRAETEAERLGVVAVIHDPFQDLPKLMEVIVHHLGRRIQVVPEEPLEDEDRPSRPSGEPATDGAPPAKDPRRSSGSYRVSQVSGLSQPTTHVGVPPRDPRRASQAPASSDSKFRDTLRYGVETDEARRGSQPPEPSRPSRPPERLEFRPPPLPEVGSLTDFSVPMLVHRCAAERFSGMLVLRKAPHEKGIFFRNGDLIFIESDIPEEALGAYLRRIGRLSRDALDQAEMEVESSGKRLDDVLVAKGLIDPNDLFQILIEHIKEKLVSSFAWLDGVFALETGSAPEYPVPPVRLKTRRVLLDGIDRYYHEGLLDQILRIPDHTFIYQRSDAPFPIEQLELNTREARLLDLARQGESLGGLIRAASGRRVEVLRLLYALYVMEVIGFTLAPTGRRSSIPPPQREGLLGGEAVAVGGPDRPSDVQGRPQEAQALLAEEDSSMRGSPVPPPPDSSIQIHKDLIDLEDSDLFKILGIGRDASTEDVHKAFRARAKQFHPDKLKNYPAEVQKRGADIYRRLVDGYRVLADPRQRAQYLEDIQDPEKLKQRIEAEHKAQAEADHEASLQIAKSSEVAEAKKPERKAPPPSPEETLFQEAKAALRTEKLEEGLSKLKGLVERVPGVARYDAWLGWAIYIVNPDRVKAAEKYLDAARKTDPRLADPYLLMAWINEHEGANDQAKEFYKKALELEPDNVDVAREERLFDIRVRKGKTRRRPETKSEARAREKKGSGSGLNQDVGSLLKKLFGKK